MIPSRRAWRLLVISCLSPLAFGAPAGFAAPVLVDRLEASANQSLILRSDLKKFRHTIGLRSQLDPLFSGNPLASKGAAASDSEITTFLINEKLIAEQFPVSDAEVEQEINSIQASNRIDRAALKSALAAQGYSFDDYFELIRMSASKRNLIDRDIRTKATISDDDVKNYYYNQYSRTAGTQLSYSLQIISVSISNYKNAAAAKEVAARALSEIKGGESFSEVARKMSDHASAPSGGDLGFLTEDQMVPAIREQVKQMKIGGLSAVFGGPASGAYFLLRLADVRSDDSDRLQKMKDEIRAQLLAAEYQHQISLWLERQAQNAFIHRAGEASTAIPNNP